MPKYLLPLLLLLLALPAQAQNVRLQLFDHVEGTVIMNNQPLPPGTEVWVVTKPETRAVRLREGHGEVVAGLSSATRDRVGQNGYTEGTYPPTPQASRAYFVVARLPDGRIFQSYVRTGDAGMQPGFDAVQGGRMSMGLAPQGVRNQLAPALTAAPAPEASPIEEPAQPEGAEAEDAPLPEDLDLPDFPDTSLLSDDSALAAMRPVPVPMREAEDEEPVEEESPGASRGWLWFLLGLVAGGAGAYFAAAAYYERLLRRQRENLLRYVPMPNEKPEAETDAPEPDEETPGA